MTDRRPNFGRMWRKATSPIGMYFLAMAALLAVAAAHASSFGVSVVCVLFGIVVLNLYRTL